MKLSELRKCDNCHDVLAPQGQFYVLRLSLALINRQAYQEVVGLATMFGGALGLAEVMGPRADDVVKVAGDEEPSLMTEFLICSKCYLSGPVDLAIMTEALRARRQHD